MTTEANIESNDLPPTTTSSSSWEVVSPLPVAGKLTRPCHTDGGPAKEAGCMFPFIYRGKTYTSCTAVNTKGGRPWCSTRLDSRGRYMRDRWGYCNDGCLGVTSLHSTTLSVGGKIVEKYLQSFYWILFQNGTLYLMLRRHKPWTHRL